MAFKFEEYGAQEDTVLLENYSYDTALIGFTHDGRAVYDYEKMIEWLMETEEWDYDSAADWVNYNTLRAIPYMGSMAPIVMYGMPEEC